jgi:hypothetical protein
MIKDDLIKLIRSLSATERLGFKRHIKMHALGKTYVKLFHTIDSSQNLPAMELSEELKRDFSGSTLDNAAAYLIKILTDILVTQRINQDSGYSRYYSLLKVKLYEERSLQSMAKKELRVLQEEALDQQDFLIYYQATRLELNQESLKAVPDFEEQELVEKQFQAQSSLRNLLRLNEHFSLYELLSHRLAMQRQHNSSSLKPFNFDDLALTELGIVTRGTQHLFNSNKLHLLFQAHFFIEKGKYPSALKTFMELNSLMEGNASKWDFPPYDYLSTLKGILSGLTNAKQYDDMNYFIDKINNLAESSYPEHFLKLCKQNSLYYNLQKLVNQFDFVQALNDLKSFEPTIYRTELALSNIEHLRLLFYGGVSAFESKKFKVSLRYISYAINTYSKTFGSETYRQCRLLYLMIHAELNNYELMEYEIRSYRRAFPKPKEFKDIEEALFHCAKFDARTCSKAQRLRFISKIKLLLTKNVDAESPANLLNIKGWITNRYTVL